MASSQQRFATLIKTQLGGCQEYSAARWVVNSLKCVPSLMNMQTCFNAPAICSRGPQTLKRTKFPAPPFPTCVNNTCGNRSEVCTCSLGTMRLCDCRSQESGTNDPNRGQGATERNYPSSWIYSSWTQW